MGWFDELRTQFTRKAEQEAAAARRSAAEYEELHELAGPLEQRFSPVVVPVVEEFLQVVGWQGSVAVHVTAQVHWVVPNRSYAEPEHPSYALVTVWLPPKEQRFTVFLTRTLLSGYGPHPKWGYGTPQAKAKLTAVSLAETLTTLYKSTQSV